MLCGGEQLLRQHRRVVVVGLGFVGGRIVGLVGLCRVGRSRVVLEEERLGIGLVLEGEHRSQKVDIDREEHQQDIDLERQREEGEGEDWPKDCMEHILYLVLYLALHLEEGEHQEAKKQSLGCKVVVLVDQEEGHNPLGLGTPEEDRQVLHIVHIVHIDHTDQEDHHTLLLEVVEVDHRSTTFVLVVRWKSVEMRQTQARPDDVVVELGPRIKATIVIYTSLNEGGLMRQCTVDGPLFIH